MYLNRRAGGFTIRLLPRFFYSLEKAKDESAQTIVDRIIGEIDGFADDAPQHDDITLLVLKSLNG